MPNFPAPFQCYRPAYHKVYGTVCISPENRILLVRGRDTGKWSFPKGHREGRESFLDCARRETLEETGVELDGQQPTACHKLAHGEYYFFELDEEPGLNPSDTQEVVEARWMSVEEMRRHPVNVDVNYFLDRLRRSAFRAAQRPCPS